MIRRKSYGLFASWALCLCLLIVSCKPNSKSHKLRISRDSLENFQPEIDKQFENIDPDTTTAVKKAIDSQNSITTSDSGYIELSIKVVRWLSENNIGAINEKIHPVLGVIFSPYAFIDSPQVWKAILPSSRHEDSLYHWGYYDGSGDSIIMSFDDYYHSFVYCANFLAVLDTAINRPVHSGNSLNNFSDEFPDAKYVDFHVNGTEEYGFLDWRVLRLGFQRYENRWYLIAIIHDEWTS